MLCRSFSGRDEGQLLGAGEPFDSGLPAKRGGLIGQGFMIDEGEGPP